MRVFGITGGIGVGKSYILQLFARAGFPTYNADRRAKELMETPDLRRELSLLLGEEAYTPEGRLNRPYVAARIFQEPALLQKVNHLVHPLTITDFLSWVQEQASRGHTAVFKEAALTLEAGAYAGLEALILVYAPLKLRIQRLKQRDGYSEAEILRRLYNQWPEWKKIAHADFLLINDESIPLEVQLRSFFKRYGLPLPLFLRDDACLSPPSL
ncbi:MAG: dephospho-CoA kinase [Bacteroidia bacterium]|nr:dephospho-CoA kinase [Bacteroidia bacterium]